MTLNDNASSAVVGEADVGPRLKHFRQALHKMLQATIKQCSGLEGTEQCFPFTGISSAQLQQLDEALRNQLERLHGEISTPVEQLLTSKDVPSKLNEVDSYLAAHPSDDGAACSDLATRSQDPPSLVTRCRMAEVKREAIQRLSTRVETLRWQLDQRRQELASRQEALRRRSEHLRDAQRLYEVALETGALPNGTGQLETLVDRMIHQHHQTVPTDQGNANTVTVNIP